MLSELTRIQSAHPLIETIQQQPRELLSHPSTTQSLETQHMLDAAVHTCSHDVNQHVTIIIIWLFSENVTDIIIKVSLTVAV